MKRKKIVFMAILCALCVILAFVLIKVLSPKPHIPKTVTLFIATDNHYLSPQLTDYGEHFMQIIQNADSKVTHYSPQIIKAFIAQAMDQKPDAVILSGDLTLNGSLESHEELSEMLKALPQAGIPVFVLPGNHDVDVDAYRFFGDTTEAFQGASSEEFRALYGPLGYDAALSEDRATLSYTARITDGLILLMLDVNGYEGIGFVPESTLKWAENELKAAKKRGDMVIGVSHQNLLVHNERFTFGYQINNGDKLLDLYKKYGVVLNFSGHIHIQHIKTEKGVTDIVNTALAVSPNQYGVLTVGRNFSLDYETAPVDVSAWARANGETDPNLLNFAQYARDFFDNTSRDRRAAQYADYDAETAKRAVDFAVELNRHYFAGTLNQISKSQFLEYEKSMPEGFMSSYINGFKADLDKDMSHWHRKGR